MASLQEQFLKAGLVDKNKVKQTNQDKARQKKIERRTGTESVRARDIPAAMEAFDRVLITKIRSDQIGRAHV